MTYWLHKNFRCYNAAGNGQGLFLKHHRTKVHKRWLRYYGFCIVRNPFTRSRSRYLLYLKRKASDPAGDQKYPDNMSFVDYLRFLLQEPNDKSSWSQSMFIDSCNGKVSGILRLENIESDVKKLPFYHDDVTEFPKLHDSSYEEKTGFGDEEVSLITSLYDEDFYRFGYSKVPNADL